MTNVKQFEILKILKKHTINSFVELSKCIEQKTYYKPICPINEVKSVYEFLLQNEYVKDFSLTKKGELEIESCKVSNAIILAAGSSEITAKGMYSIPKGLYVVNGEILIERQIRQLKETGINDIYVVIGNRKHVYLYLQEKFDVQLIVNIQPKKNNIFSLFAASEYLLNSYICNCDNYYTDNPFDLYERDSYHSTVYKKDSSKELLVTKNINNRITSLYTSNDGGECIYGHAFFNKEFSETIREFILKKINDFRIDSLFWEEFFAKYILDLDMYARCYDDKFLLEFDTIQEVQNIDNLFIENVSEQAIDKICAILKCKVEDIKEIKILSKGLSNILFTFYYKNKKYVFRFPGASTANIITSRKKEVVAQKIAAKSGVDNTYVYIDESGCKLSKWVHNSKNLSDLYYKDDCLMIELAKKIRLFHDNGFLYNGKEELYFNPIEDADRLLSLAYETMGDSFKRFSSLREDIIKLFNYCEADGIRKTICHNDINADNVLLTDTTLDVIDYEFAGYNDPAYDFGRIIGDYDFHGDRIDMVLEAYFKRPASKDEKRHWIAYVAIHDWYYFCWAIYKESINEDTREWMLYFYDKVRSVAPYALKLYEEK